MYVGMPITTTAWPSVGSLLGSSGNQSLIDSINSSLGSTDFFGSIRDIYADIRHVFIDNIVAPIKATAAMIHDAVTTLINPDVIRPLVTVEDFHHIPPSMHLPILLFEPVQQLFQQGRISGFGYNPAYFEGCEDAYGRLINNGTVVDVLANVDAEGNVPLEYEFRSSDPEFTDNELTALEETRMFIQQLLETSKLDPTDIVEERG